MEPALKQGCPESRNPKMHAAHAGLHSESACWHTMGNRRKNVLAKVRDALPLPRKKK